MSFGYKCVSTIFVKIVLGQNSIWQCSRDRIVVSTSRCGRDNPGSNPGHGRALWVSLCHGKPVTFFASCSNPNQCHKLEM